MPYKPNPEARGVSRKADREGNEKVQRCTYNRSDTVYSVSCTETLVALKPEAAACNRGMAEASRDSSQNERHTKTRH